MSKNMKVGLIRDRHRIPVDVFVFDFVRNPINIEQLNIESYNALSEIKRQGIEHIDLYVTGLTTALVSVLNSCKELELDVTLWHHNKQTGGYFRQEVLN